MKLPLQPLEDRLLLTLDERPTTTGFGLHLPDSAVREPHRYGTVLAVGPGHISEAGVLRPVTDVEVGDKVLIGGFGGTEVDIAGESFVLIPRREVLAVVIQ